MQAGRRIRSRKKQHPSWFMNRQFRKIRQALGRERGGGCFALELGHIMMLLALPNNETIFFFLVFSVVT